MKKAILPFLLFFAGSVRAQTISGLSYSPSDTTIVASWTTDTSANSNLSCTSKAAIDNGVAANSTTHQCIVTGLAPTTVYSCTATSGSTSSTPQNVTTLAAATRTAPIAAYNGPSTSIGNHGDSVSTFVSNDNNTYAIMNDGYGFAASPGGGANMQIGLITNEATLLGQLGNLLTAYGLYATQNGTDGPGGTALSNKLFDIMSMGGVLFTTQARQLNPGEYDGIQLYQDYFGNIMASPDHGATWNSWQAPSVYNANGVPPSPLGSYMFANGNIGAVMFVKYAIDDGTLGYLTTGNRIDGADGWIYLHYKLATEGLMNGSHEYLMRMPRIQLAAQSTTSIGYWIGPTSPAPSDFVNDSNWSSSPTSATAIYTSAYKVSWADMVFVPVLNSYVWFQWYYNSGSGTLVATNSTWTFLTAPTPAGPWTQFFTMNSNPQGWFHPAAMHRAVASNILPNNIRIPIVYSGNYQSGTSYYYPTISTLTLNPIASMSNATLSQGASIR
jgi:hypothetical protein